jgi:hypothetical protein
MKLGRYKIKFGRYCWIQTRAPTTARRFLCFWLFKEARLEDVDSKQQFPLGTRLEHEGRVYHYYRAGSNISVDRIITDTEDFEVKE